MFPTATNKVYSGAQQTEFQPILTPVNDVVQVIPFDDLATALFVPVCEITTNNGISGAYVNAPQPPSITLRVVQVKASGDVANPLSKPGL